jgi:hypothetical protein
MVCAGKCAEVVGCVLFLPQRPSRGRRGVQSVRIFSGSFLGALCVLCGDMFGGPVKAVALGRAFLPQWSREAEGAEIVKGWGWAGKRFRVGFEPLTGADESIRESRSGECDWGCWRADVGFWF